MRRRPDWDVRLVRLQDDVLGEPFRWGETDCASIVRRALAAMYPEGEVPLPSAPPEYEDRRGAGRAYVESGGVAAMLEAGGAERVDLNFARQGDVLVGLAEQGGFPGGAVVVEEHFLVASEEEGVVRRPLRALRLEEPDDVEVWRPPV